MPPLRTLFFGTPAITLPTLRALVQDPLVDLIGVVTQPDKPKGRDLKLEPSPAKLFAQQHGLPFWQPPKAREPAFVDLVASLAPEIIVVLAYGQILPQALLDIPKFHCLNIHTSLLPKYRGAAPIQWAILNGDGETGVTLMQMEAGLDTGPIIAMARTPIDPADTAVTVHDRLAELGAGLLAQSLPGWVSGAIPAQPQPDGFTYARKITKEDGALEWCRPASALRNQINALIPWPGTFTHWDGPKGRQVIKVWKGAVVDKSGASGTVIEAGPQGLTVACGEHALLLTELQREGGRRLPAEQFLAGFPLPVGARFATATGDS